ncbi:hypothetical protein HanRHA438_Chr11g0480531 [Helianthus annuus]|uniref:Uncharacterized protein n=1 Tax=Helianthus annuus TaxID=4232 RepID=A0A9K3MYK9_HELAN|nr:hypothetical protein HanXRQr2_Chr11g0466551 [Helianthus annuus]KAJ0507129.1 hypothetical protein HanIR_Chr11g0502941 [Helianthus annuus]KAJ0515698.1 hypothetical protein HanHA89_Chr11g0405751 [Helianthus annuus]KAJ0687675.1 hypothetical protein HanOQP8_Chr11g0386071 [Helianthus annuus]KAJ0732884.1 hypothetical protein HanPI659440_Chr11g0402391 [Helianthus annuus]
MAKKRKSLATSLDEVDRTMHSTFCSAANSLSQLYSQAMSHQKLSFLSGERHGLVEKLYQWISKQQGEGMRVTSDDILAYIQAELESYVEEPSMTPRNFHQQHNQATSANPFTNSGPSSVPIADQQPRNYIFSNALSSPVRRSLQNYHISHQNRDSIDSSMDMHADNESTH